MLREEGLGTGAEALTFKRVFDRVEEDTGVRLTNASVIRRVWENQAEFQVDVLVTIALGDYDGLGICEFPDTVSVAACSMKAASTGAFARFETTALLTAGEACLLYTSPSPRD